MIDAISFQPVLRREWKKFVLAMLESSTSFLVHVLVVCGIIHIALVLAAVSFVEFITENRNNPIRFFEVFSLAPTDKVGGVAAFKPKFKAFLVLNLLKSERRRDVRGAGASLYLVQVLETIIVAGLGACLCVQEKNLCVAHDAVVPAVLSEPRRAVIINVTVVMRDIFPNEVPFIYKVTLVPVDTAVSVCGLEIGFSRSEIFSI